MKTALILAGAVAKGAFEAGVIDELERKGVEIGSIVSTSAGSLNAALYATGVRFNRPRLAVDTLLALWRDHAGWLDIVKPTLMGLIEGTGLSKTDTLQRLLFDAMQRVSREPPVGAPAQVKVQLVTTNLSGATLDKNGIQATTFERLLTFADSAFDTEQGRQDIAQAALASAAFPMLFVPVDVKNVGPCVDGGVVNNTPINWAIEAGIERVIVVTGNPRTFKAEQHLGGGELVGKEVDIAINERLFRDLYQARQVNEKLAALQKAFDAMSLDAAQRAQILGILRWKPLQLIEIRPEEALDGNAFSALHRPELRAKYIEAGQRAARQALP